MWEVFAYALAYLALARTLKLCSKTVQLHSIVHCFVASLVSGVVFYGILGSEVFGLNVYPHILKIEDESQRLLLKQVAYHSAGYFLGDTVDIYIDSSNVKRKEFVLHHVFSFAG